MKVTSEFLKEKRACNEGLKWVIKNKLIDLEDVDLLQVLVKDKKLEWANWLIVRVMTYKQYIAYAIFAAEQVIDIFEKKYPEDNRPRKAIEAAKKCLENPTAENNADAAYVAYAAYAAYAAYVADAAYAAYAVAAAAYAAYAADAVAAAAYAADAAYAYADADAADADAANTGMRIKILEYGISLLKEQQ